MELVRLSIKTEITFASGHLTLDDGAIAASDVISDAVWRSLTHFRHYVLG